MLFSIIVPIYGVELYLRQCLDSILAQTVRDFEAILVDDGSIDSCPAICDEYSTKDKRFKVIHKSNGGLVSARQAGVEVATGDYVVCVDGDDWISPNYLKHFSDIIDRFQPDVLVCDCIYAYPDKTVEIHNNLRKGFYSKDDLENEIYPCLIYRDQNRNAFPAQLWAKAFKNKIYRQEQQQINVNVKIGEDRVCVIPTLYHSESMYVSDDCDYYYRQIPTSMTKAKRPFRTDGPMLIYEHFQRTLDLNKYNLQLQLYRGTCHSLFNVCKSQFYSKDRYWEIVKRIGDILKNPVYDNCIRQASFSYSFTRKMMLLALKYRLYFLCIYIQG